MWAIYQVEREMLRLLCKQGIVGSIPIVSTIKVPGSEAASVISCEDNVAVPLSSQ